MTVRRLFFMPALWVLAWCAPALGGRAGPEPTPSPKAPAEQAADQETGAEGKTQKKFDDRVPAEVYALRQERISGGILLLLKAQESRPAHNGNSYLPIYIGLPEALAIWRAKRGDRPPRPMTHDLLANTIRRLNGRVLRVTVSKLEQGTFFASVTVKVNAEEIQIDARPSDAIALAVRAKATIYIADSLLGGDAALGSPSRGPGEDEPDDVDTAMEYSF